MLQIARKRIRHKPGNRVVLALNKKFNTVQKLALPSHTEVASSDVSTNTTMTTYLSSQSTETSTTKIKSVTESGEAMSNCHSKDLNHSNHEFENFKKEIEEWKVYVYTILKRNLIITEFIIFCSYASYFICNKFCNSQVPIAPVFFYFYFNYFYFFS